MYSFVIIIFILNYLKVQYILPLLVIEVIHAQYNIDQWLLLEDPPHAGFTANTGANVVSLVAGNQAIPNATDIGFSSIDSGSAYLPSGPFFDPNNRFSLAIDYDVSFASASYDGLAIGFGIGEDTDGMNSAGVSLLFNSSSFFNGAIGAASRTNDVSSGFPLLLGGGSPVGSMFVSYDAPTGDVTVGYGNSTQISSIASYTFNGVQNGWTDDNLLVSFFLRSDSTLGNAWSGGGTATATFSNFRIIDGPIPEPSSGVLLGMGAMSFLVRRQR